jgi:hypothetical protein
MRAVANEVGVSHMTVGRVLDGQQVDLDTLEAIAHWLGIPLVTVLEARNDQLEPNAQIQLLMGMSPRLSQALRDAYNAISIGSATLDLLDQMADFLKFHLNQLIKSDEGEHRP